jgi:hypothetical protein
MSYPSVSKWLMGKGFLGAFLGFSNLIAQMIDFSATFWALAVSPAVLSPKSPS